MKNTVHAYIVGSSSGSSTPVVLESGDTNQSPVSVADVSKELAAAAAGVRLFVYLHNRGATTLYVMVDGSDATEAEGIPVPAGAGITLFIGAPIQAQINGIRPVGASAENVIVATVEAT